MTSKVYDRILGAAAVACGVASLVLGAVFVVVGVDKFADGTYTFVRSPWGIATVVVLMVGVALLWIADGWRGAWQRSS